MATTFDEAQNLLLEQDLDDEVAPLVIYVMSVLKDTYAPTIKMTKNQKNAFDEAKRALNTRDLALNFGQEWTILDEVSGKVFGHGQGKATNEQIESIMQAWLHPETIKVVE